MSIHTRFSSTHANEVAKTRINCKFSHDICVTSRTRRRYHEELPPEAPPAGYRYRVVEIPLDEALDYPGAADIYGPDYELLNQQLYEQQLYEQQLFEQELLQQQLYEEEARLAAQEAYRRRMTRPEVRYEPMLLEEVPRIPPYIKFKKQPQSLIKALVGRRSHGHV